MALAAMFHATAKYWPLTTLACRCIGEALVGAEVVAVLVFHIVSFNYEGWLVCFSELSTDSKRAL